MAIMLPLPSMSSEPSLVQLTVAMKSEPEETTSGA
jgi:hypothetical protein